MSRLEFGVRAERWLRLRRGGDGVDPPFDLDGEGFLSERSAAEEGGLLSPDAVVGQRVLVLLGEPGAGKTTMFAGVTGASAVTVPPLPGGSGTLWVTGADLADAASVRGRLTDYLVALPAAGQGSAKELVVVIDQLDESPMRRELARHVESALVGRETRGLRVFVACRTAEYPSRLTGVLERALGSCLVADLAPLRRGDVALLVESTGTPADEFLRLVVENKAGMLAGVPLTLKVLLAAYLRGPAELSGGPVRLFELGVAALVDEPNAGRAAPIETVAEQRVAIASRVAAYMLLCGQRTLWMGGLAGKGVRDVSPEAVCGAVESSGAGTFQVTPSAVLETTRTALFTWTGEDRVAFAHSSFAAYLAAHYLAARYREAAQRGKEREARRQLAGVLVVTAPEEETASIPGYLQETVAWLLGHAPAETDWLAQADPEGLAAYSAYITSPDVRRELVDGLLARSVSIELTDRGWQRARWQLHHPGFGDQIRAVLEASSGGNVLPLERLSRVRLAVRLAHDSRVVENVPSLVGVAESSEWPVDLRWSAAYAAIDTAPELAAPRLRRLLAAAAPSDELADAPVNAGGVDVPRELAIELLGMLWPAHLSFDEAAPHFHPFRQGAS